MAARDQLYDRYARVLEPLFDRREFLQLAAMAAAGLAVGGCGCLESLIERINNRPTRREINSLDPGDPIIEAYKAAVSAMRALPSSDPRNWTEQARIHFDFCPHGNWLFLPWHRFYLYFFEEICREMSGMEEFALPYWNWSLDGHIPAVFWGDASNPLVHSRGATSSSVADPGVVGPSEIQDILDETSFISFGSDSIPASTGQRTGAGYGSLEGSPHNYIHGFIGGDMGGYWSPLDPIFWLHHNMVECIWVKWNLELGNPNTNDPEWTDRRFTEFVDRTGAPLDLTVLHGLLYPILNYQYDGGSKGTDGLAAGAVAAARARHQPATEGALEELKAFLREGARVRLDYLQRYPLATTAPIPVRKPAVLRIPIEPRVLRGAVIDGDGRRVVLELEGVTLNHTEDFYVRVFALDPNADADSSLESPNYVGSFAFFGHAHDDHEDHSRGRYRLDLTSALRQIGDLGDTLDISLVPVPFQGRDLRTREFGLQRANVAIVRDVVG